MPRRIALTIMIGGFLLATGAPAETTLTWTGVAVPLRLPIEIDFEGAAHGGFTAPLLDQFETTTPATLMPQQLDWNILHDGWTTLTITTWYDFEFDYIRCYPSRYESLTVAELTVTVICDSAVPVARSTWGTIRAFYR